MSSNKSSSGAGGVIFFIFVLIALVPKPVWIVLGVATALGVVGWAGYKIVVALEQHSHEAEERARIAKAKQAGSSPRPPA